MSVNETFNSYDYCYSYITPTRELSDLQPRARGCELDTLRVWVITNLCFVASCSHTVAMITSKIPHVSQQAWKGSWEEVIQHCKLV